MAEENSPRICSVPCLLCAPNMETSSIQTAEFYDREWAEKWQDMKAYSPVARHTRRLIRNLLDGLEYHSLVDIGCGNGALLRELDLESCPIDICGIDFSEVAVALADRQIQGRFFHMNIQKESLSETFDVGICSEVLEHLEDDLVALKNIWQMCRHVIITVPSGPLTSSAKLMGHVRHYTKEDLSHKLFVAGFRICNLRAWGTPFHDPIYAWVRGQAPAGATTGQYGVLRWGISHILYALFFLNVFDRGHKLVVLAERI